MRYWLYSEGNILGPYDPAEMLALPAFAEESLVCPETATGDSPGDWRPASQTGEIASALSFGAGRTITAGVVAGAYEYETGFSSSVSYFENKEPSSWERPPDSQNSGASYGELLDTIDNILGAYKGSPSPGAGSPYSGPGKPAETDYDLAEKFDIRLSHIQEELEAARWEKNLLLEKIRMKELEEKKNCARIEELEARLKRELGKSYDGTKKLEQVRYLVESREKAETVRQIEEIRKEELELRRDIAPVPQPSSSAQQAPITELPLKPGTVSEIRAPEEKPGPKTEVKSFKSITGAVEIKLETSLGKELKGEAEDPGLTSRKFRSLGQTQAPAYAYSPHHDEPLPGPEAAPPGAFNPEAFKPLPQQAGGIVYDFTVVTAKQMETQQFKIETRQEAPPEPRPVKPAPAQNQTTQRQENFQFQPFLHAPVSAPAPIPQAGAPEAPSVSPAAQPSSAPVPAQQEAAPAAVPGAPDKTLRVTVPALKGKPDAKAPEKAGKKGGKLAFIAVLVLFGSMAAGGLGYFFMGEGVSFSEFSLLNLGGKKKPAAMGSQLEAKTAEPAPAPQKAEPAPAPEPQPTTQPQPAPVGKPAGTGENIKKALDIVKGYKLSGGRGNVVTWFANSFLSGVSSGANEEWTATPLHGDILVVQYRLLRPRQEPLIYQFEVDAAKRDIVRGINNNAIELLDFSSKEKSVSAAPAGKPTARPRPRKTSKPGGIPILPLPDAPSAGAQPEQDPTGFENTPAEGSEQVKYLKAQESDEELF